MKCAADIVFRGLTVLPGETSFMLIPKFLWQETGADLQNIEYVDNPTLAPEFFREIKIAIPTKLCPYV